MDPVTNWLQQRELARAILERAERGTESHRECLDLAELVEGLHLWIEAGGFMPWPGRWDRDK
jgi:hypothetical protein